MSKKTWRSRSEENLSERRSDEGRFEDDQSYKPENQPDRARWSRNENNIAGRGSDGKNHNEIKRKRRQ